MRWHWKNGKSRLQWFYSERLKEDGLLERLFDAEQVRSPSEAAYDFYKGRVIPASILAGVSALFPGNSFASEVHSRRHSTALLGLFSFNACRINLNKLPVCL